jgi:hypothetical protein
MTKRLVWWDLKYADWSKPTDIQKLLAVLNFWGKIPEG